jgi:hypothetical protein
MAGELAPYRRYAPEQREAGRAIARLAARTQVEQAAIRATSAVAEFGMSEVMYLKRVQGELEKVCPDATEALAVIANTAALSIARQVHRFGSEVG